MRSDAGQGGVIGRGWLQDSEWGPGDPSNNQHTHTLLSVDDEDDGGVGGDDADPVHPGTHRMMMMMMTETVHRPVACRVC